MTDETTAANPAQGEAAPEAAPDNAEANAQAPVENEGKPEGEQAKAPSEDADKKKQSRYDRKIGALTYQARQAQREAAELRERLAEVEKRTAPQAKPKPIRAGYETEDDFIEALTDWKLETKLSERDKAAPKQEQTEPKGVSKEDWEKRETAFADKTHDYNDAIDDLDIPRTLTGAAVSHAILKHEKGPEVLYHLAKNPDVLDDVLSLLPERASFKINRIAESLGKSAAPKQQLPHPPSGIKATSGGGSKTVAKMSGRDILKHLEEIRK
jgi:hypothetical protein